MSIEMRSIEGMSCPVVICDVCTNQITDGDGIVVYEMDRGSDAPPLLFVHKSRPPSCNEVAKSLQDQQGWDDLDVWMYYLIHNAGVDITPDVIERAKSL